MCREKAADGIVDERFDLYSKLLAGGGNGEEGGKNYCLVVNEEVDGGDGEWNENWKQCWKSLRASRKACLSIRSIPHLWVALPFSFPRDGAMGVPPPRVFFSLFPSRLIFLSLVFAPLSAIHWIFNRCFNLFSFPSSHQKLLCSLRLRSNVENVMSTKRMLLHKGESQRNG
jgi:hypothetical protein